MGKHNPEHTLSVTVEPPNKDHLGEMAFVPCREAGPISEASVISPYFTILHLLQSFCLS